MKLIHDNDEVCAEIIPFNIDGKIHIFDQQKIETFAKTLADGSPHFHPDYSSIRTAALRAEFLLEEESGLSHWQRIGVPMSCFIDGRLRPVTDNPIRYGLRFDAIWLKDGWHVVGGNRFVTEPGERVALWPFVHMSEDRVKLIKAAGKNPDRFSRHAMRAVGGRSKAIWGTPDDPRVA
jgi:hypothetical protein